MEVSAMPEPLVHVSGTVPLRVYEALSKYVKDHNISRSRALARALEDFLKKEGYLGGGKE